MVCIAGSSKPGSRMAAPARIPVASASTGKTIVSTQTVVRQIRSHPLLRALRADKLTYAALGATLRAWALERGPEEVPVARMIGAAREEIARRATAVAAAIATPVLHTTLVDGVSTIGGGSAPGSELPTCLIALVHSCTSDGRTTIQIAATTPRPEGNRHDERSASRLD